LCFRATASSWVALTLGAFGVERKPFEPCQQEAAETERSWEANGNEPGATSGTSRPDL